ncbi:putative golgi apparatus membrane protein TVP15 [Lupinus albus]|uniref:Putative golgi apparatus membrane protein TVP15 n=1 Tax=Lupinus albus TaxID=3870 RepID=A0A6A4PAU7_LUPAL|nr:putative golgi apparatus membrane protein TVP15 [Lupinus albus]
MSTNDGEVEENVPAVTLTSRTRIRRRPDPFLVACRCFSFVTCLAAILCIVVNILSAVRSFRHGSDIFDGIFRCYAVVIAFLVVLAETEWSFIIKFWKVSEYWVARGMLQIFVAVMTRAFPDYFGERKELVTFQSMASYLLLACGLVYVVSGVLCIGFLKRSRQKQEITVEQAAKDLEGLERRRAELEQLLLEERV